MEKQEKRFYLLIPSPRLTAICNSATQVYLSLSSMDYSDQERAYEFERLIEAGDWKAVMAIVSEFEGAGESDSLHVSKFQKWNTTVN